MTKTEMRDKNFKELVRALGRVALEEGAPSMYRADLCGSNWFWRSRYNHKHVKGTPGFHVSRLMEEVANEEGWVFAYDTRANGTRDNIRIEFIVNASNKLKAA